MNSYLCTEKASLTKAVNQVTEQYRAELTDIYLFINWMIGIFMITDSSVKETE